VEEDPFEEIVLEPRKKPVVWVVYVLLFAVAVPWYWPTGYSGHAVMGLPLWVAVTVAAVILLALWTTFVITHYWRDSGDEEGGE
jgi:hypothetical protein